ncbi:HCL242Cp [Eremothecium sinecaudum]|uniref:leucine--tRNA ligase n=1 Tax=Eremothecium sinecaudum TaxID=45286 RepID=A0A0X8HR44_9SACH|nr:HCL242Cp [Eremothecium sinecaudum]AMD19909.1 HCL242Cp [Eremothecium sinecaudum]
MRLLTLRLSKRFTSTAHHIDLLAIGEKWKKKTVLPIPTVSKKSPKDDIYVLAMFPYPSGMLHIGHLRVYTISDTLNRFYQMKGYNVIHPIGWDAFGLPAENAALERGVDPAVWTKQNIAKMKQQLAMMLANFNWDRELTTCYPEYYKFTQEIFLKLFKRGLAYRKEAEINWDPVDQTVLANEQVDSEGRSWRSGAIVEKKQLRQWFLGIETFAHELLHDLDKLQEWPSNVKAMQKNWIGESHGTELRFKTNTDVLISAFTTRVDTIFSIQYIALALDHPIVQDAAKKDTDLAQFINSNKDLPNNSKTGYQVKRLYCSNPLSAGAEFNIPVFAAPYVVGKYGSGAVMGCPAHDERDYEFWKNCMPNEPVICTVEPKSGDFELPYASEHGILNSNAGELSGLTTKEARKIITTMLEQKGLGESKTQYRLRDWLISRQRYWGTPIPIIHCEACGPVAVPDEDLPVTLPKLEGLPSKGNPLANINDFVNTTCPSCGSPAKRETDTMDTFMDSSWYFFRHLSPDHAKAPFKFEDATKNMPVNIYIGGVEHSILHLLYARFISKFLASIGMWDGRKHAGEPFKKLVTQGMVHGKTYVNPSNGRFLKPDELDFSRKDSPLIKSTGELPVVSYEKMSKSKYNGVDPADCISKYGPDATRAHILFQAPIDEVLMWDETKIVGIERWLTRVIKLARAFSIKYDSLIKDPTPPLESLEEINFHNEFYSLLGSITDSFERSLSLNTVVSDYMKLTNLIEQAVKSGSVDEKLIVKSLQHLITVIYPVVPSISEECFSILLHGKSPTWTHYKWPRLEGLKESKTVEYKVIIDGKMRCIYPSEKGFFQDKEQVVTLLRSSPKCSKYLHKKTVKNVIIKNNLISLVLEK